MSKVNYQKFSTNKWNKCDTIKISSAGQDGIPLAIAEELAEKLKLSTNDDDQSAEASVNNDNEDDDDESSTTEDRGNWNHVY